MFESDGLGADKTHLFTIELSYQTVAAAAAAPEPDGLHPSRTKGDSDRVWRGMLKAKLGPPSGGRQPAWYRSNLSRFDCSMDSMHVEMMHVWKTP